MANALHDLKAKSVKSKRIGLFLLLPRRRPASLARPNGSLYPIRQCQIHHLEDLDLQELLE
jgi:hypothetical protein